MTGTLHVHPDGDPPPGTGPLCDPVDADLAAARILRLLAHERRADRGAGGGHASPPQ
ncbi:hypothetical protein [Nocardioides ferulae]|uniref:hypothetical protein n=1 Tax=Nocardioides ferulae TaxID=2340821 RepID=UPI0013DE44D0|nr:hypothetical protein [Nocardioides ferulae]